jgi:hypothetical protein
MRERPILFSGPMVRALLDGSKTQTRRVAIPKRSIEPMTDECPYGAPGDRLWVRESAWLYGQWWKDGFTKSGRQRWTFSMAYGQQVRYEKPRDDEMTYFGSSYPGFSFRPSIHVPRWASRLTLTITDVRVERLQAITDADAKGEGVTPPAGYTYINGTPCYRDSFRSLWNELNSSRGYGWDANPWVWVVSFERTTEAAANAGGGA